MNYKKTIRILDPFGGWGCHPDYYNNSLDMSTTKGDTGLCNRLFHWELFYDLYEKSNDDDVHLAVQSWIWPEAPILDLPNTVFVDYKIHSSDWYSHGKHGDMYFKTIFDEETDTVDFAKKLTYDKIMDMYKSNIFDYNSINHWYTDKGYVTLQKLYFDLYDIDDVHNTLVDRPLSKLTFRDKKIHRKIEKDSVQKIGIHLRRGNGVFIMEDDIKSMPLELQDEYRKYIKDFISVKNSIYPFQKDSIYFRFIDSILEKRPNQKFYISHDLPDRFIDHYYERYGNLITSKKETRSYYINYFSKTIKNLNHLVSYANIVDNLVDLFSLANCEYLVTSPGSTWSEFAKIYTNKKSIHAYEIDDKLNQNKDEFLEDVLSFRHNTQNII